MEKTEQLGTFCFASLQTLELPLDWQVARALWPSPPGCLLGRKPQTLIEYKSRPLGWVQDAPHPPGWGRWDCSQKWASQTLLHTDPLGAWVGLARECVSPTLPPGIHVAHARTPLCKAKGPSPFQLVSGPLMSLVGLRKFSLPSSRS